MKTILLAMTVILAGCSPALIEKLSTDTFSGRETIPFVNEHPIGVDNGATGILKRLVVHNPLTTDIEAHISCSSMFMDDPTVIVRARKVRYLLISANHSQVHSQSCFLTGYTVLP